VLDDLLPPDRLTHIIERPAQDGVPGIPLALDPRVEAALQARGVHGLYQHQSEAIRAIREGHDVMVTTGTGSGKSLCYQIPILEMALREPRGRAILLFPTKALTQDQFLALDRFLPGEGIGVATYDGDTPAGARGAIRKQAQIVLTNPDMLHVGILPNHEPWQSFLRNLRYVVVDEAHVYRGVFGSHVAWVLRRLLRLAEWASGRRPQFIFGSATIADAEAAGMRLSGQRPVVITRDGSPQGPRRLILVEPALEREAGANLLTARLMVDLAQRGAKSLAFCRARATTEMVLRKAREIATERGVSTDLLDSYRAGYTPAERRSLEAAISRGDVRSLVSTNALELGVDIGGLDAVVINGWPGSRAAFWQQSGRAGRGGRSGLTIFLAHEDPLEAHIARQAGEALFGSPEPAPTNPENPHIARAQIGCLAHERPFRDEEAETWGAAQTVPSHMVEAGELAQGAGLYVWNAHRSPAGRINIRGADEGQIVLRVGREVLGTVDGRRAWSEVFPGAVYLHRGQSYVVERLDVARGEAWLRADDPGYSTMSLDETLVVRQLTLEESGSWALVSVEVTERVVGYLRRAWAGELIDQLPLETPSQTFSTLAVSLTLPMGVEPGAVHGVEHLLSSLAPGFAGCDRNDLGSGWFAFDPFAGGPTVTIFDVVPGGVGLAEALFAARNRWVKAAYAVVTQCDCAGGCPRCLYMPKCPSRNEPLDKAETARVLGGLL